MNVLLLGHPLRIRTYAEVPEPRRCHAAKQKSHESCALGVPSGGNGCDPPFALGAATELAICSLRSQMTPNIERVVCDGMGGKKSLL